MGVDLGWAEGAEAKFSSSAEGADDLSATFRMMPPEVADLLSLDTRGNRHLE